MGRHAHRLGSPAPSGLSERDGVVITTCSGWHDAEASRADRGCRCSRRLRRGVRAAKLRTVVSDDIRNVLAAVEAEQARTARQIASLQAVVAAIVEGAELTSTDDEHDPEGATIAYERAQASALLRQAREDGDALVVTRRQLEEYEQLACSVCGREIDLERVAALPTTTRCVRCAA